MANGSFKTPFPKNEPVLSYTPGSPEKAAVKAELARQKSEVLEIPLVIDGERIFERETDNVTIPHDHSHVIGKSRRVNKDDVSAAINAALSARKSWAALPWQDRGCRLPESCRFAYNNLQS